MKLIVGLGNPGSEYEFTRHNIGFMSLDKIAKELNIKIDKNKFGGLYGETILNNEKVIFLKPQKYINLSGEVIIEYVKYFKIPIEDVLIIHDDLDLECGKIRLRYKGSSGGHNGLKNIEKYLNTNEYKRIRVGISNDKMYDTKDYVLGKPSKEDTNKIQQAVDQIFDIINDYLIISFDKLMSKYN